MTSQPRPGEVWQVDFGPPVPGRAALVRPAVVIAPIDVREWPGRNVVVVPVTSRDRGRPSDVPLRALDNSGLTIKSFAQCELLTSIPTSMFSSQLGTIDPDDWQRIRWIVGAFLGYL